MHPDLQERNLDRLPLTIRRIASAAAKPNRTFAQVQRARNFMTGNLTKEQRLGFLPVWFFNLDPARVPRPAILETLEQNPAAVEDISCAAVSLLGLFDIGPAWDTAVSLWPRVWPWVDFIHLHWHYLEGFPALGSQQEFYISYISCLHRFHRDSDAETLVLITSTPNFWSTLVKGWTFLADVDDSLDRRIMLNGIGGFAADAEVSKHPERLQEMIDEVGSIDILARLVMDFIAAVLKKTSRDAFVFVNRLLLFISDIDGRTRAEADWHEVPLGRLSSRLASMGFSWQLVCALLAICQILEPDIDRVANQCMRLLTRIIGHIGPNTWLVDHLQCGLLHAVLLLARNCTIYGWNSNEHVEFFMETAIPTGLVYYYPASVLKTSITAADAVISGDAFKKNAQLSEMWQQFLGRVTENLKVLGDVQDGGSFVAYRACDNTQCCNIQTGESMAGRCSSCQAFYYCSSACQRADWKLRHNAACADYEHLLLSARLSAPQLRHRERWFIRALIQNRYMHERRSICVQQVKLLASCHAESTAGLRPIIFTLFDFAFSPPSVGVHTVDPAHPSQIDPELPAGSLLDTEGPEWADLVSRADKDRGYMHLHGMRVIDGGGLQIVIIPLRTNNLAVYEGLVGLAHQMCLGEVTEEEMVDRVDALLAANAHVVEIH
ncbi:hypothetical protein FB45DRAFT_1062462 [Roridomyces roridus]|uniref:MYND-type domain-containing protein n=1 Tax=Roridomyces roridus TaxID=1738132 RepID=A0AAD7BG36_9AGAR|nr:hypothetical protein FB45DRAFT_1062462 [Roridomyces roridus]